MLPVSFWDQGRLQCSINTEYYIMNLRPFDLSLERFEILEIRVTGERQRRSWEVPSEKRHWRCKDNLSGCNTCDPTDCQGQGWLGDLLVRLSPPSPLHVHPSRSCVPGRRSKPSLMEEEHLWSRILKDCSSSHNYENEGLNPTWLSPTSSSSL